ncbi:SMR domain-containing protein At5g58720 isoform X1 [Phoenix dactylifera]|uniref:SMR domain-containing protein At5g58720 isoform X1 n=1 Tax=Phoenix dactylifera TaxID=42345 RepID=A0A8B7CAH2_PHODC|nr:SMR domain-containing protein At5g58720 isoform X1 [Phoenix dactylifera]
MKPSKKQSKKKRTTSSASCLIPSAPGGGDDPQIKKEEKGEGEDEERKAVDWLIDTFVSVSLDQVKSTFREAGGDPFKAAGILGAQLEDPGESSAASPVASGAKMGLGGRRKQKRVATATGMVSDVIGKEYSKPSAFCGGGRRRSDGSLEGKGAVMRLHSAEEAEEFLYSMLGESSELGMGVVEDVLGQFGCDVEKALDALLDISASSYNQERSCDTYSKACMNYLGIYTELSSKNHSEKNRSSFQSTDKTPESTYHPSEKEHNFLQYVGYDCRDYKKVCAGSEVVPPSRLERTTPDLQQKVLESLFNTPDHPKCKPILMNWKKVVEKVESFGQGLEFCSPSVTGTQQNVKNGKEDTYQLFQSVAGKHWDTMKAYYQQAAIAYSRGERGHASHLSEKGKFYRNLAREADEKAGREIFEARNRDIKNIVTIDLHGQHVKQASRLLKLHLLLFVYIPSVHFLKVITGRGADGVGNGKGKLKRMVLGLAEKEGIKWREENAGAIVLHLDGLKEYSFMDCDADDFE